MLPEKRLPVAYPIERGGKRGSAQLPRPNSHLGSDGQALSYQTCARICAQDAAGRGETRETPQTQHERSPSVLRGQRGDQRRRETAETHVVWLITQRSRVQIPPPLPSLQVRGLFRSWKGPSACAVCTELCTRPLRRAAVATGGETYPRTSFATQTTYDFY